MQSSAERPDPNHTPHREPDLNELMSDFDEADTMLRMSYSRYCDKPSWQRMDDISRANAQLFDSFGEFLRKVMHDSTGVIDAESRPAILATVLHDMAINHSDLVAEYSDAVLPSTDEQKKVALEVITDHLESHADSMSDLVDAALEYFRQTMTTDMEVLERFIIEHAQSPKERLKDQARQASVEVAKIGIGVVAALFLHDRLGRG